MSKLASEFVSKKSYDGQVHVATSLLFDKVFEEQRKIRDPFLHKTVLIDRIHTQHDICLIESGLTRCLVKVGVGGGLTSPIHHISLKLQEYILTSFNIV